MIERDVRLMLPSFEEGPQRSPQLLRGDEEARRGGAELLDPWVVPALGLEPATALGPLLAQRATGHAGGAAGPNRVALGDSLRFLADAAKLALELVARGRVLPGLVRREEGWGARWHAMPRDPEDVGRMRVLAAAMPPRVRAERALAEEGDAPEAVIADLLGVIVDACARTCLAGGLAGRRARGRPKRRLPVVDAWVAALTA